MTGIELACALLIAALSLGWRLTWLATRVDRAHHRVERAWAALDAALVRRAQRAAELAGGAHLDPASALLLSDAAGAALEADLTAPQRELAESDLSHVLEMLSPAGIADEQQRASLGRRLYNDAVSTARGLRDRRTVRLFRLAGNAQQPRSFEMADPRGLVWLREG
jgi:hypothetical protein